MPDMPSPALKPGFRIDGDAILSREGEAIAHCNPVERRVMWDFARLGVSAELQAMAEAEAQLWDRWAHGHEERFGLGPDPARLTLARWLRRFPEFAEVLDAIGRPLELHDAAVLNIGGTGQDLIHWLGERPRHIDHVEVSPRSQAWCARKVGAFEQQTGATVPITFHTVPAEHLPFADDAFDFIFARSTIHHCERPAVLDELVRVLKPGGIVLFWEFFLNDALYALAMAARKLRRLDRGSDDPLRPRAIAYCERLLAAQGGRSAKLYLAPVTSLIAKRSHRKRASALTAMKVVFAGTK